MRVTILFISLGLLLLCTACESKSSPKQDFELKELCGKRAEQVYKVFKENNGLTNSEYECHYNSKLKRCLIHITDLPAGEIRSYLIDVNENKRYATYISRLMGNDQNDNCFIENKPCQNKDQWDSYVKKMMEE